jgi:hypothetical protein
MACSLNTISSIDDLSRIRAVLLPHLLDSISDNDYPTSDTDATEDDEMPSEINISTRKSKQIFIFFLASESVARTAALLSRYGKKKKKSSGGRQQWLRECQLAFSPTLNLLVTAFDQQIVVSTGYNSFFSKYILYFFLLNLIARNKTSSHEQSNFTASFDTKLQVESK